MRKELYPIWDQDAYLNFGYVQVIVFEFRVCANNPTQCECRDASLNYAYVQIVVFEF